MPGSSIGGLKASLDRHRAASTRLSCISEHQKENTRNSEDDGTSSAAQAVSIKTPSLGPVRWPRSRYHAKGNSQGSGDGSSISTFQLDSEQVEITGKQLIQNRPLALATWPYTATIESKAQIGQYEALDAEPSKPAPPELMEVQWKVVQWTEAQLENVYAKQHRRTLSATGFDGPRSSTSGTSPHHSPSDRPSSPLGSLLLGNCLPCNSRKPKSDASGSIDWEKSWPKRKPRRRHDVSESSDPDPSASKHSVGSHAMDMESKTMTGLPKLEEQEHPSRPCSIQGCAFKSCPELYRRSPSAIPPLTSRFRPGQGYGLESPNYSQLDIGRHRRRRYMPDRVSKRFRSLRDRLHRGRSSSMYSIRPEFPPPPDGKERRYRSRNSNDIWPSSGEESPLFNTPESNISPVQTAGHHADLLAASGLMMATAELDRLSASAGNTPRTSAATSLELPRTPVTRSLELPRVSAVATLELPRISSGTDSPQSGSGSSIADAPPVVPSNSSCSLFPPGSLVSPMSRSPKRVGQKSRRKHSRLSEVTTPDEVGPFTQLRNSSDNSPQLVYSTSQLLQHPCQGFGDERCESLIPLPLSISRPSSSNDKPDGGYPPDLVPAVIQRIPSHKDSSEVTVGPGIILPQRTSSRSPTPEPLSEQTDSNDQGSAKQSRFDQISSTKRPSIMASMSEPIYAQPMLVELGRMDIVAQESALFADVMERLNSNERNTALSRFGSNSCHPDTWSEGQGEPGDSEPFCPPECLYSNRCSHGSDP